MESRRDIKRAIEKEIKRGSAPVIYTGLRFEPDTYHLIPDEDKMNHVLDYLFRNGEFANLADEQIRSNIYLDSFMGMMNFRSAKNDLDKTALEATAKKHLECIFLQCLMERKEVIKRQPMLAEYSEDMKRIYMLDNVDVLFQCLLLDTMNEDNGQFVAQMTASFRI